jgi:hypothetical protein
MFWQLSGVPRSNFKYLKIGCGLYYSNYDTVVRFEVLTVTIMKLAVFWDVAPCILVITDRRFRGVYCLHHQADD